MARRGRQNNRCAGLAKPQADGWNRASARLGSTPTPMGRQTREAAPAQIPPTGSRGAGGGDFASNAYPAASISSAAHGAHSNDRAYTEARVSQTSRLASAASSSQLRNLELCGVLGGACPGSVSLGGQSWPADAPGGSPSSVSRTGGDTTIQMGSSTRGGQVRIEQEAQSLSSAIMVCSHRGDFVRAEDLIRKMEELSYDSMVDAYNSIVHACARAGDMDRVEMYLHRMKEKGAEPSLATYNSLIAACAATGDTVRAEKWLLDIVNQGMKPNRATYCNICKVFACLGGIRQIESIMRLLESSGMELTEQFYSSLITACGVCNPPDPARAERALVELSRRGLCPQRVEHSLVHVVGTSRTVQLMQMLWHIDSVDFGTGGPAVLPLTSGGAAGAAPPTDQRASSGGAQAAVPAPRALAAELPTQPWGLALAAAAA